MKQKRLSGNVADLMFPMSLMLVFALSAILVITLATDSYKKISDQSALNYTSQTALAYVTEKIHQSDGTGGVELTSLDGCDALRLWIRKEGQLYYTYIYLFDGYLREQFVKDGSPVYANEGDPLLAVKDFTITSPKEGLFTFVCRDENSRTTTTTVTVRSHP